jgi:Arrestin (or S-antigen), C-terminal domain
LLTRVLWQPRIEGKVEIRPSVGISAPVSISLVTIALYRRETIHPAADSVTKKHLAAPRKEVVDIVGKEMLLFRCTAGRQEEDILSMDLPFILFIPFGRGGEDAGRRVPPASLTLPSRIAETYYELVVMVQQGPQEQKKYAFPVPILRYDTLSTFGMYNRPESAEQTSDHLVTLGISLPRWSYGPLDPVSVYIKLSPNPDWMSKAKRVTIKTITIGIEEQITYNHEGDVPQVKVNKIARQVQTVNKKMPDEGYFTTMGLVFPAKDLRDSEGVIPRGKKEFPNYTVSGFTTRGTLYKLEYFLTVKVSATSAYTSSRTILIEGRQAYPRQET